MKDFNVKECVGNIYYNKGGAGFDIFYVIDKTFLTINFSSLEIISENYELIVKGGFLGDDCPPSGVLYLLGVFFE